MFHPDMRAEMNAQRLAELHHQANDRRAVALAREGRAVRRATSQRLLPHLGIVGRAVRSPWGRVARDAPSTRRGKPAAERL